MSPKTSAAPGVPAQAPSSPATAGPSSSGSGNPARKKAVAAARSQPPSATPVPTNSQTQTPQAAPAQQSVGPTVKRPPPIVLRFKQNWPAISRHLSQIGIKVLKARSISQGISVHLATPTDFRKVTAMLDKENLPYHTYQLDEEKTIKVVLRRIPADVPVEEITECLRENNIPVISAHRMTSRSGHPYELVYVNVEKTEAGKKVFNIRQFWDMPIKVEPKRKSNGTSQCHRCQQVGHVQARCRAFFACVKCAGNHPSTECSLPADAKAKCVNCQGDHPASYRGCPYLAPHFRKKAPTPMPSEKVHSSGRKEGVSYAQSLGGSQRASSSPAPPGVNMSLSEMLFKMMMAAPTDAEKQTLALAFARAFGTSQ